MKDVMLACKFCGVEYAVNNDRPWSEENMALVHDKPRFVRHRMEQHELLCACATCISLKSRTCDGRTQPGQCSKRVEDPRELSYVQRCAAEWNVEAEKYWRQQRQLAAEERRARKKAAKT